MVRYPAMVGPATPIRTAADLVAQIEARISGGELAPGDRLDPVRACAADIGLAPNTVAAAYRTLGERGYVIGRGRRGTFVAPRPALALPPAALPPLAGLVDLASGNPDPHLLPPLQPALDALDAAELGRVRYGSAPLDDELVALLGADLEDDGVDARHLVVVSGALDGLERVLAAHLRTGDRLVVEDPGYPAVAQLATAMGLEPVPALVDELGFVPEALERALGLGAAVVVLTPRAQNPTGAALDPTRAAELIAVLADHPEVLVVEDDHAGAVAGQPYQHVAGPDRERWATIRSVAKSLGPDLRLAAVVGDERTMGRVAGRQALGPGWVSHLLQHLVRHLLASSEVRVGLEVAARSYGERRDVVTAALRQAGYPVVSRSGMNVWVPVADEAGVVAAMERRRFAIASGARFRHTAPPGVRCSIAGTDLAAVAEAADALVEVLRHRPPVRSV